MRRESEEGKREGENSFWISAYKRTLLVFKWQNRQSIFYSRHLINVHAYFAVHTTNVRLRDQQKCLRDQPKCLRDQPKCLRD